MERPLHDFHEEADDGEEFYDDTWTPGTDSDNFKVVIRVRPPLPRELRGTGIRPFQCTVDVDHTARHLTLSENLPAVISGGPSNGMLYATYRFTFDHVYDQGSSQQELYNTTAQQVVLSILQGYNAAIIAYGQTGTGKTFTMEGELEGQQRGIIPRTVEDIFTYIVNDPEPTSKYLVRASYLQIYNEVISDLLKPERTSLIIREDKRRGVFVEGLSEWVVRSPRGGLPAHEQGPVAGATKLNEVSSRSHAVCIIIVEKCTAASGPSGPPGVEESSLSASWSRPPTATGISGSMMGLAPQSIKVGKLNLVDLAGSERVHVTGAVGKRLEESKKINASLSALGNVIAALTDRRERTHIPYRDSKLTRILEDSLGGNCRTTMICTIAPAMDAFQESLSTLKFANRAKNIKNEAHVNEDLDQRTLLRKYERELRKLRAELTRRNRELVDKRHLLEVEEQKKRAEADKLAALTALEKRSREFLREKEEKRQLEAKISVMQSQLLVGGSALEDVPAFRALLAREHKRIRGEYEARLRELESEREGVQEDRAQVDRYKQLLLKQRDIMIALTARLNERDEQIMALQEELEAYDKYGRQLEDALDGKTAELIALRRAAVEQQASVASGSSPANGKTAAANMQSALGVWGSAAGVAGDRKARTASSELQHDPRSQPQPGSYSLSHFQQQQHQHQHKGHQHQQQPGGVGAVEVAFEGFGAGGGGGSSGGGNSHAHASQGGGGSRPRSRSGGVDRDLDQEEADRATAVMSSEVVSELAGRLEESEASVAELREENIRLAGAVAAAAVAAKEALAAHSRGSRGGRSTSEPTAHAEMSRAVQLLSTACRTAQRERSALQQILEVKVQGMMGDLIEEEEAVAMMHGRDPPNQRTLAKLRTLEDVLGKINNAIKHAPPHHSRLELAVSLSSCA
ncbi:MAG: hypothetical protein WDW36_008349 [Sanguina aurantia]